MQTNHECGATSRVCDLRQLYHHTLLQLIRNLNPVAQTSASKMKVLSIIEGALSDGLAEPPELNGEEVVLLQDVVRILSGVLRAISGVDVLRNVQALAGVEGELNSIVDSYKAAQRVNRVGVRRGSLLNTSKLAREMGVDRNFVVRMVRAGYRMTNGKKTTLQSALDWLSENPDFRTNGCIAVRKAGAPASDVPPPENAEVVVQEPELVGNLHD